MVLQWWRNSPLWRKILVIFVAFWCVVIIVGAVAGDGAGETAQPTEERTGPSPQQMTREAEDAAKEREKAEEQRRGLHCLALDGNHPMFEFAVKNKLTDPGSMDTDATRIMPVNDGEHLIVMNFRARNALGGMVQLQASGLIDNETCDVITVLAVE